MIRKGKKPHGLIRIDANHPLGRRILHWWSGVPARGTIVPDLAGNTPLVFTDGGGESPSWKNDEFSTNDLQNGPYAASANVPFPQLPGGIALSCWFKTDRDWALAAGGKYAGLISFGDIYGNGYDHCGLFIQEAAANIRLWFRLRGPSAGGLTYAYYGFADTTAYAQEWVHLVGTVTAVGATPVLYANGAALTPTASGALGDAYPASTDAWLMGRVSEASEASDYSFPGQIKNAMVIDGFITARDVWDLYRDQYGALIEK